MVATINGWLTADTELPDTAPGTRAIGYINPHVFNVSCDCTVVTQFINTCTLVCIDGIGTALALKRNTRHKIHRVVALHLFDALVEHLGTPCDAVLIGVSSAEVAQSAENINQLSSHFNIVASMDGFSSADEYDRFLNKHASVQWVLIGAGSPKSESIALQAMNICSHAIVFHMGAGTIKVYAGSKRRAPDWVSRYGMEWAHRMIYEPHTRERYARGSLLFLKRLNSTGKPNQSTNLQENKTERRS